LSPAERDAVLQALPLWRLGEGGKSIERCFTAKNFVAAIDWFNRVTALAEAETHHPDLHLTNYRDVRVVLSTHAVGGLTQPDAIMAAKLDHLPVEYSPKWLEQHPEARHTAVRGPA
jgi:4a-hydroxytetrahydrobiopterin dehydratase